MEGPGEAEVAELDDALLRKEDVGGLPDSSKGFEPLFPSGWGLGFRVWGFGVYRAWGLGFRVLGFWGFRLLQVLVQLLLL